MHVISKKPFNEAARRYPSHAGAIIATYKLLVGKSYRSPEELKKAFGSLDNFKYKDHWWVIDIAGNHLRLIAFIDFTYQKLYVKHILTHSEYDRLCDRARKGRL